MSEIRLQAAGRWDTEVCGSNHVAGQDSMTPQPGRPIFIVGCARSGTTIVNLMLGSHPNICSASESHILVDFARWERRHRKWLAGLGVDHGDWVERTCDFFGG